MRDAEENTRRDEAGDSRKQAEKVYKSKKGLYAENLAMATPENVQRLLHELQVHQIELEMQNEELLRIQLALEVARARYFDLYDLAPVGYCTLNEKGLIMESNMLVAELLGVARRELNRQMFSQFIVADDEDTFYNHRRLLFGTGQPLSCEIRIRRQAGAIFWVRLQSDVLIEPEGNPIHLITLTDINTRKLAEEQLLAERAGLEKRVSERTAELNRANFELVKVGRVKDEFLASISHELRTPLTSILGLTEVLRAQAYGSLNLKQSQAMADIEISGRQLLGLVNATLDYSLILTGHLDVRLAPCLLVDACQVSLDEITPLAEQKQQQTSFSFDELTTLVRMDERRLQQMLMYLLNNATKFTPPGGSFGIEIKTSETEKLALVTVWDKGVGIKSEDLPRLFQGFAQLDGGAGLGLALVKRLVELQGGSISVESVFGSGSRFTLKLPLVVLSEA